MPQVFRPTRRALLAASACWLADRAPLLAAGDFWNRKEPAQWTSEEIERLTTDSPWAKPVSVLAAHPGRGEPVSRTGGFGRMGTGRVDGSIGRGGTGIDTRAGDVPMQFKGVVRWESARPVLEALKFALPSEFNNHYVISVSGIPILDERRRRAAGGETDETVAKAATAEALERVQALTYLEPKGKEPAQPGLARRLPGAARTVLFGFSKEILQLSTGDKEVTFTSQFGNLQVKAKFNLKEMTYRKQLAV